MQIVAVWQDLSQVKAQFGEEFQSVLQNCAVKIFFGLRTNESMKYVSELSGTQEVITGSRSVSVDRQTGEPVIGHSHAQHKRFLINPDECGALEDDECLIFSEGVKHVIKAKRRPYMSEFKGCYGPNPYFKEEKRA